MVRRKVIASAIATGMVAVAGVPAVLSLGSGPPPPPAASQAAEPAPPVTVVRQEFVDDLVYVATPAPADAAGGSPAPTAAAAAPLASADAPWATPDRTAPASAALDGRRSDDRDATTAPPTSAILPPTTQPTPGLPPTTAPTTSTTLPPGAEVPSDWPPGTPYPPIPPGCREPHLEDDGVWNCEH